MKNLFVTAIMIAMSIPMIACEKFDDFDAMSRANIVTNTDINAAVTAKYPNARIVDVDRDFRTYEVEIVDNNIKREVYFDLSLKWIRTETDVRHSELPTAVTNRLASKYSGWYVDGVKLIDTPQGSYYRIELDKGEREKHVEITPTGEII